MRMLWEAGVVEAVDERLACLQRVVEEVGVSCRLEWEVVVEESPCHSQVWTCLESVEVVDHQTVEEVVDERTYYQVVKSVLEAAVAHVATICRRRLQGWW
jgi:hypothetical protein